VKVEVSKSPDNQVELTITIPSARVREAREEIVKEKAKDINLQGFRKGHAPESLVKDRISPEELNSGIINRLVGEAYSSAVKEHHLRPIISPKIELLQFAPEEDQDLVFKATTAERPPIELGDYKQAVKKAGGGKILGPDGKPVKDSKGEPFNDLVKAVLEQAQTKIPQILVEEEVNRMLARLIDQTAKLGMTVEQYLQSQQKSVEDLKKEYAKQVQETIKTELVLDEIANKEGLSVSDAEIEQAIRANPDEKSRKEFARAQNKWYIKTIIKRNKVLEFLRKTAEEKNV
jgi:FKBP-type peptidyl-prolyl cis-trans isomerase (trigger factor)